MCGVCGCGESQIHSHHDDELEHVHDHHHTHHHEHHHDHQAEHSHAPGLSQSRMVQIEQDILAKNNQYAGENRRYFGEHSILALNLVSSPGSGKTTLLTETISRLKNEIEMAVIEGDQQTARDAERIRATGVQALQINTGKGCHLDAHRVGHGLESLQLKDHSLLFIENVGNLACPAAFDLGEAHKVVILSVTEGEDKPIKYPDMFHAADLMILNKIDLLPHLDFDSRQCIQYAKQVNPRIKVLSLSAKTGEGMDNWLRWLKAELELQLIEYV